MKIALVFLGLVCVALYFAYPVFRAKKISEGVQAHSVRYEQHPQDAALHILVAGDSTGVGTGARDPKESVAGRIGADIPHADIQNISENGLKLEGLRTILQALPEKHYGLIVLQIGANDVTAFTPPQGCSA